MICMQAEPRQWPPLGRNTASWPARAAEEKDVALCCPDVSGPAVGWQPDRLPKEPPGRRAELLSGGVVNLSAIGQTKITDLSSTLGCDC